MAVVGKRSLREREQLQRILRELRVDRGLRQIDVARAVKRHQSFVSKYETGERRLDILEIREVCGALGISLASFAKLLERALR